MNFKVLFILIIFVIVLVGGLIYVNSILGVIKQIDPATPSDIKNKYPGKTLIWSNEFKDWNRIRTDFTFEQEPANTLGIGPQAYVGDQLCKLTSNGLYLGMDLNRNNPSTVCDGDLCGVYNVATDEGKNGGVAAPHQWNSSKITSRLNGRFCYGTIECKIRCPKIIGAWAAFWLNFCHGQYMPNSDDTKIVNSLDPSYPFPCSNYWAPEIDIMERYSPVLFDKTVFPTIGGDPTVCSDCSQNQSSLHSPNQYTGLPVNEDYMRQCPNGNCNGAGPNPGSPCVPRVPGSGYCFGLSQFMKDWVNPATNFIEYKCEWSPTAVSFWQDGKFMGTITENNYVMYSNGAVGPVVITSVPMFFIFNIANVPSGGPDQSGPGTWDSQNGWSRPGIGSRYNFDANGNFKTDGMEIQYLRVYQDNDKLTGLNPTLTTVQKQTILAHKVGANIYHPGCGVTGNTSTDDINSIFQNACTALGSMKDNYCLGVDSAIVSNNGGTFSATGDGKNNTNQQYLIQRTNAVLAHMANKYGMCCDTQSCQVSSHVESLPVDYLNSDWYTKIGFPARDIIPKAPCIGSETLNDFNLSGFNCQ